MPASIIDFYSRQQQSGRYPGPVGRQRSSDGFFDYGCAHWCRHVVSGRIQVPKRCTRQEECYHCAFDQMLDEYDRSA